jgi:hypothetical protein
VTEKEVDLPGPEERLFPALGFNEDEFQASKRPVSKPKTYKDGPQCGLCGRKHTWSQGGDWYCPTCGWMKARAVPR